MLWIDNRGSTDPTLNLALEEYAVRHLDPARNYVLFYINEPSIIIGKNQNTLEEINHEYVAEQGIHVVRRISGGGTVYHDFGNLNFSFIQKYEQGMVLNFERFTRPVIAVLKALGVPAELTGRNDIVAGGRKISGNAQFFTAKRMLSHGTLLYDSELDRVVEALNVKMSKIESKGLKSVRSRVANIRELVDDPSLTIEQLRTHLVDGLFEGRAAVERLRFSDDEWREIEALADSKYRTWDWNYGRSPAFNVEKRERIEGVGELDARIDVEKGVIRSVRIFGDYFGERDIAELEQRFVGVRFDREALDAILDGVDVGAYIAGLDRAEFVRFLY